MKSKLFLIVLTIFAVAIGAQSCSDDEQQAYVKVTGITVTPNETVLLIDGTTTLVADVFPQLATDKSVVWKSDSTHIVTVDDHGVVTALAEGTAKISVTSVANSAKTDTCVITVVSTFSVSLNATSLLIPVEATRTLKATIIPDNISQDVNWTSDNTSVVTVDENGVITAVAPGTAKITAASVIDESRMAECEVTVADVSSVPASKWLAGMWTFEDEANPGKATVGEDLEANGDFTSIDGPGGAKAVKPGANAYYTIRHNIGANGGGEYVNEYTLMMDIRGSAADFSEWISVFNNSTGNGGDGSLWIDGDGKIGVAGLGGYSSTGLTPDTWHRVTIAVKLGDSFRIYIDGELVFTASQGYGVDGSMSLYPDVVFIGYDGSGYPGPDFAEVRMWDIQLTDEQASALGMP
jgi:hypothetical protein